MKLRLEKANMVYWLCKFYDVLSTNRKELLNYLTNYQLQTVTYFILHFGISKLNDLSNQMQILTPTTICILSDLINL